MTVRVLGARELAVDMETMRELIEDPELVTKELDRLMTKFVAVRTGHLQSTIYHKGNVAGAQADYAGWVEEMGDEYAYATRAIEGFNVNKYADQIVEPF